ncbi:hypothetical protein O9G_002383 [Rozella allomycis CSF55]|uniref:Tim44-like domain-containing protein n=1 Tax=Rozella allomycis (strain CSF55) TaxID=988480 RepID=A0A075AUB0_ROZAC|nr:hypothetical protein O9G_002383 [Rozella allomycis CSF55]|eukprot:EPZ33745.1 hypothetical protein O9G_002383 [Rozella allomycis CSF55]
MLSSRLINQLTLRSLRPSYIGLQSVLNRRSYGIIKNFIEEVKKEANKDQEFQKGVKKLEENIIVVKKSKFAERARAIAQQSKEELKQQNEELFRRASEMKEKVDKVTSKIGETTGKITESITPSDDTLETLKKVVDNPVVNTVSDGLSTAKDVIVDERNSLRYGGFYKKEYRDKIRGERLEAHRLKVLEEEKMKALENPDAGTSVTLHQESAWKQKWDDFSNNNSIIRSAKMIKQNFDESNNVLVYHARNLVYSMKSETGKVTRVLMDRDPSFSIDSFLKEATEFILPEIIESYVNCDKDALKPWLFEAPGLFIEGKVLDMREIEINKLLMVDQEPVITITAHVQQVSFYRNKNGEIVEGKEVNSLHLFERTI